MQPVSKSQRASIVNPACDIDDVSNMSYIGDTGGTGEKMLGGDTGSTMETTLIVPERSSVYSARFHEDPRATYLLKITERLRLRSQAISG
jgi:hypothetical protein